MRGGIERGIGAPIHVEIYPRVPLLTSTHRYAYNTVLLRTSECECDTVDATNPRASLMHGPWRMEWCDRPGRYSMLTTQTTSKTNALELGKFGMIRTSKNTSAWGLAHSLDTPLQMASTNAVFVPLLILTP